MSFFAFAMDHINLTNTVRAAVDQAIDVRKRPSVLHDLIGDRPRHHFEAGEVDIGRLAE